MEEKITKRNKHSRKFMTMRNKKYSGGGILDEKNRAIYDAQPELAVPIRRIEDEEEVFRHVDPVVGRCYDHVESTRRVGTYPNIRYFAPSLDRVYVGRFVREERRGFGDGEQIYAIFVNNNRQERRVQYSSNTCFIELPCPRGFIQRFFGKMFSKKY